MTALASYSTGTVSVSAGGTTATGSGTIWNDGSVKPGDILQIGNFQSVITDVTDATHLVIPPWGGGLQSGATYVIWQVSPQRFAGAEAMSTVNRLATALNAREIPVVVGDDETVPDPSLGEEDQTAIQPSTGKVWVMSGGIWTFLGIYRGFNLTGAYDNATVYGYGDVQTTSGTSYVYINATPSAGHAAPNATYWQVLAAKGDPGAAGAAATVAVGTVTTVALGAPATVTNSGSSSAAVLDFQIPAGVLQNYLSGLTLSTAGSSASFGIAAGLAADDGNVDYMRLAAAITKTTGAWAVGAGNGALDTGTIANSTWYHVFEIKRPDTGVVDVLISTSPSAPTMPTNYTLKRRIGSMKTNGSAQWTKFTQFGDEFLWGTPVAGDATAASLSAAQLFALTVPPGVQVFAKFTGYTNSASGNNEVGFSSPDQSAGSTDAGGTIQGAGVGTYQSWGLMRIRTDTSRQIRAQSSNVCSLRITTHGWDDLRGKV
ncbi:hypothetical protein CO683_27015 [Bradyrhizobium ottawaense]|uniref:hypothetical protein n=1 Tax=Bradyrhizobium ottawaense TaxID=931866 RepID=UPI000BE80541|nr:hypothetical protein [Bradyrhizobium ottawaense]PDT66393.1 hypothetical protein CO683_27015 [Bradyrhizobium ottawaense]